MTIPASSSSRSRQATAGDTAAFAPLLERIHGSLVVSCQAPEGHPLRSQELISRMAEAAVQGGAVAVRVNGPGDIAAVRQRLGVPIIGLWKVDGQHRPTITPSITHAIKLVEAGADILAIEVTEEAPHDGLDLIHKIHRALGVPVMADISDAREGRAAWAAGADLVGTTLSGYARDQLPTPTEPDLALVDRLVRDGLRVVAEGRYASAEQVRRAFELGAHAVVVGSAITDPISITRRFVAAAPASHGEQ